MAPLCDLEKGRLLFQDTPPHTRPTACAGNNLDCDQGSDTQMMVYCEVIRTQFWMTGKVHSMLLMTYSITSHNVKCWLVTRCYLKHKFFILCNISNLSKYNNMRRKLGEKTLEGCIPVFLRVLYIIAGWKDYRWFLFFLLYFLYFWYFLGGMFIIR